MFVCFYLRPCVITSATQIKWVSCTSIYDSVQTAQRVWQLNLNAHCTRSTPRIAYLILTRNLILFVLYLDKHDKKYIKLSWNIY